MRTATWGRSTATSGAPGPRRTAAHIDQIAGVVHALHKQPGFPPPSSSAPGTWPMWTTMALPPCHTLFQFYVADGRLSCQLYQRSADLFPGRAFQHRLLRSADHDGGPGHAAIAPGEFVHTLGRCPSLSQSPGAGATSSSPASRTRCRPCNQPGVTIFRLPLRRF